MSSPKSEKMPLLHDSNKIVKEWNNNSADSDSVHIDIDDYTSVLNRREKNGDLNEIKTKIMLPSPERDEARYPPEKAKTLMAFLFLSFGLFLNLVCLSIIHDRVPSTPPLPDVFFDLFPAHDWALDVSEIIIIASVWITLVILLIHRHRFIILRRVFIIMGILYFMRSITMFVTQVPVASTTYYCSPKANVTTFPLVMRRVGHLMGGMGLSINGQHIFCGDYIFSGHTVILTMAYLVVREYTSARCWILQWLSFIASSVGVIMVLLSRGHYTVDIVIAYYITTRVFWIYHTLANNVSMKHNYQNNFLARIWWFPFFRYFEKNVNGPVPKHYEWPLPWARRIFRRTRNS